MQARGHLLLGPPEGLGGLLISQLTSAPRQGVGAYIQFLVNEFGSVQVTAEDENC